jgi:hypothetical protein
MQTKQVPALFGRNPSKPNKVKAPTGVQSSSKPNRRPDEAKCFLLQAPKKIKKVK